MIRPKAVRGAGVRARDSSLAAIQHLQQCSAGRQRLSRRPLLGLAPLPAQQVLGKLVPGLCIGQHEGIRHSSGVCPAAAPQNAFIVSADVKTTPAQVTSAKTTLRVENTSIHLIYQM